MKKLLLAALSICCVVGGCLCLNTNVTAKASEGNVSATIDKVAYADGGTVIFHLNGADYITSELPEIITEVSQYKWVDSIAYENRENGNVHNAHLSKNLDAYNYHEKMLIDGVAVGNYEYSLFANRFQIVDGLGFTFANAVLINATEIMFKAGCTLPTLTYSYFGEGEYSGLVLEEDHLFRKRNGEWYAVEVFEGYEANTIYDASPKFFYSRPLDSSLMGHVEAPTCEYSRNYEPVGDYDYVLTSTKDTVKGSLFVMDFVNPIDTRVFGEINLRFYVHEPRTMVTYNAYNITYESLGEKLEKVVAGQSWTNISLTTPLYADENGMLDRLVFQFTNDGDLVNEERNYVGVGEFSLSDGKLDGIIHDKSLMIEETEDAYEIIFRFNKGGELANTRLDMSKIRLNGVSLSEINQGGDYVTAEWSPVQGFYQIRITVSKAYDGVAQIKNADAEYACNKITFEEGFAFPNGDLLEQTYHYTVYRHFTDRLIFEKEVLIETEKQETLTETKAVYINHFKEGSGNLYFAIEFDKMITNSVYLHACEIETWRPILGATHGYDEQIAKAFVAGGFKSSLMDSVVINGKTIGDIHATDPYQTCVFAHYGQTSYYALGVAIDTKSELYKTLEPLFEEGEGITIEIKSGLKFTTGVQTEENYTFVLRNGVFMLENDETDIAVFYDGQRVEDGETLTINHKAMEESIFVRNVAGYALTTQQNGDIITYIIAYEGGTLTFHVKQNITQNTNTTQQGGCAAVAGGSITAMLLPLAMILARRKENE